MDAIVHFFMNYKEFFKPYCFVYNWNNNREHKVYCNPYCPYFLGLSRSKQSLIPLCEFEEERKT